MVCRFVVRMDPDDVRTDVVAGRMAKIRVTQTVRKS